MGIASAAAVFYRLGFSVWFDEADSWGLSTQPLRMVINRYFLGTEVNMVLYYLLSRDLKKIEGYKFTLRAQKNSQDSVRITDEAAVPKSYCRIDARIDGVIWETVLSLLPDELSRSLESSVQETRPNADAIKAAATKDFFMLTFPLKISYQN